MKTKIGFILFLCLNILVSTGIAQSISKETKSTLAMQNYTMEQNQLKIVNSNTSVKLGSSGFITILGKPNTKYHIKTSFRKGNKTFNVTQWRSTDNNGEATFNWFVNMDTEPGIYEAIISGGGETIKTKHVVNP